MHLSLKHETPKVLGDEMKLGKMTAGLSYKLDKDTVGAVSVYKVDEKCRA